MRRRWVVVVLGLPCYTLVLAWLASLFFQLLQGETFGPLFIYPSEWVDVVLHSATWWACCGVPTLLLVASQAVFVIPVVTFQPRRGGKSGSLFASMIAAALVAAALSAALACGLYSLACLCYGDARAVLIDDNELLQLMGGVILVSSWAFWSLILMRLAQRRQGNKVLGRVIGLLVGGTVVESALVLPIDIMIRRRTQCYCETGSFFALCLSIWSLLWLAGPGAVVILFRKRHRRWFENHCEMCGYEKGPSPGENCPECGYAWKGARRATPQAVN